MAQNTKTILSIQYARWSDPSQGKGATKTRQFNKMREEAERIGYTCARQLFDEGKSAFHGHHIDRGELGKLLDEIDSGALIGWVLQIENIDRLSRQGHHAVLALVDRITRGGVSLHTCDGDHLEAHKEVTLEQVIILAVKAETARKEAEKRSDRAAASWKIRRARAKEGKALPGAGPEWLKRVGETYEEIPDYAAQARRVWEISDETGHGAYTVTRLLNEAGVPMFGTGKPWYQSRVDLILSGMEVIGYHQPRRKENHKWVPDGEPIKIYPEIIPHDLFERVRSAAQPRLETHGGGNSPTIANLLSGLCRCASCGRSMRHAGSSGGGYLMCTGRGRGLRCPNGVAYRYRLFEATVLDEFLHLTLDDNAFANKSEVARLNSLIAEREVARQVKIEEARAHLLRAAKSKLSEEMGLAAEAEAEAIAENLRALRKQREAARGRASAAEHFARVKDMRGKLAHDVDLRRKVMLAFNTVIDSVLFAADGVATVKLVGGIMEMDIDFEGNVIGGSATLTTNEQALADRHSDAKVINITRAVAQRFAKAYERGEANWSMDAQKVG